jgi:hypothetical protein
MRSKTNIMNIHNHVSYPLALQYILEYLYFGKAKEDYDILPEVKKAAESLQLSDL